MAYLKLRILRGETRHGTEPAHANYGRCTTFLMGAAQTERLHIVGKCFAALPATAALEVGYHDLWYVVVRIMCTFVFTCTC